MSRRAVRLATATIAAALVSLLPCLAAAQAPTPPGKPGARGRPAPAPAADAAAAPAATRVRLVLNLAAMPGSTSYGDVRTPVEYAETSTIRTSYDTGAGLGPDAALQVSLYRGLGLLVGYSRITRDATGTFDVSRPHPLYLNRPRTASAELSGFSYAEGALDLDAAYARPAGSLDWALFAGITLFQVEGDLVDVATFNEQYPYDQLTVLSTPARPVEESATGWNIGGRLDYRLGKSKRFGVGVQLRYSGASVQLKAAQSASGAAIDAGGLTVAGGVRLYF